jgi:hypothetical protein
MRVIVTEKGQDLRKEFFFDQINEQNQMADDIYQKSLKNNNFLETHSVKAISR